MGVIAASASACTQPALPLTLDDFTLAGVPADVDSTELRLTFGQPDSIVTAEHPLADAPLIVWVYDGFEIRFAGRSTPSGYLIHEPGERTARGLGVGDPARLVLQLYGEPAARQSSRWAYIAPADERAAELNVVELVIEADTVRSIYVGQASD